MANSRSPYKRRVSLWLTEDQRTALKLIAKTLGFQNVTELFIAVALAKIIVEERPHPDHRVLQLTVVKPDAEEVLQS